MPQAVPAEPGNIRTGPAYRFQGKAGRTYGPGAITTGKKTFNKIMSKEITTRAADYSQWYNDLVLKGGLADYTAVRGCMVIKPYGFSLWENMQAALDKMFKDTGHQN